MTVRKIVPALALLAFTQLGGCGYFHSVELPEAAGAAGGPVVIDGRPSRQKRYGAFGNRPGRAMKRAPRDSAAASGGRNGGVPGPTLAKELRR